MIKAGRSRFTLATLPAAEFPLVDEINAQQTLKLSHGEFRRLIDKTHFSMAQQDVRYYLNGTLLDLRENALRCVATDGHRLALCETAIELNAKTKRQVIIPRKGVLELQRLLDAGDGTVEIEFGRNHLRVRRGDFVFTTKLIDGRFPDYEAVIPIGADKMFSVSRDELRASLQRAAILSNEKYRGVKLELAPNKLNIVAHNPEQEEAVEELEVQTVVDGLSVGFNVNYLLDALGALRGNEVTLALRDSNSSCLIRDADNERSRHVIMPLRL